MGVILHLRVSSRDTHVIEILTDHEPRFKGTENRRSSSLSGSSKREDYRRAIESSHGRVAIVSELLASGDQHLTRDVTSKKIRSRNQPNISVMECSY